MSLVVNHNMMAANVANTLNSHYGRLSTSTQRLSSGMRINSAADDAAGLAIRELMRADIASFHQGARNANDAISMIQTADGALGVIDEKLVRMKELAEQASTGTYDSTQRLMIESEYQQMAAEITRIAYATDFNGIHLLDGNLESEKHDGSGMTATGKLKVHFGTGNDSAEDYYYVQIAESTAQAFGVGNLSTWEDASNRISKTFKETLESNIENLLKSSSYDDNLKTKINDVYSNWISEFEQGLDKFTNFSSSSELEQAYNSLKFDSEVSDLKDVFDKGINNLSSLEEREIQKIKYALGRAAMRSMAENLSVMRGFDNNRIFEVATSNVTGILAPSTTTNSALKAIPGTPGEFNYTYSSTNNKLIYVPPIDYDPTSYYSFNLTDPTKAPDGYPFSFSAPDLPTTYSNNVVKGTREYRFANDGSLSSYKTGTITTFYNQGSITGFYNTTDYVNYDSDGNISSYYDGTNWYIRDTKDGQLKDSSGTVIATPSFAPTSFLTATTAMNADSVTASQSDYVNLMSAINSTLTSALSAATQKAENYDYAGYTIATQEDAQKALVAINNAIVEKDKIRANLGSTQNRLENTITNLNTMAENLQAAESRISDVDVSTEMTEFVRNQILTQSAVAMLSQANSLPQMAMQLIGG